MNSNKDLTILEAHFINLMVIILCFMLFSVGSKVCGIAGGIMLLAEILLVISDWAF